MKKLLLLSLTAFLLAPGFVFASDEAPTPHRSPRTPVNREALPDRKPAIPASREVQGQAAIVDTERLRVDGIDLRLFGVVPPQLSASYGPQARAVLDNLVTGQNITCMIRDRDQAGRYLATCRTPGNADLAMELLRRGLAVTARGSLSSTELYAPYLAAEQGAQAQRAGLWSVITPAAAPAVEMPKLSAVPSPAVIEAKKEEKAAAKAAEKNATTAAVTTPAAVAASVLAPMPEETLAVPDLSDNFLTRYQLLITGFIMLGTALSILLVLSVQRRNEKRDEMKAIAAALRGELMAARAVCQARLKTISSEAEDKAAAWPRIRSTLYQAYVGRLGFLGAELARQVASIYGQSSDYAAYYNSLSGTTAGETPQAEAAPKRQALQTLTQHIEEVLPKLAGIEQSGQVTRNGIPPLPLTPRTITASLTAEKPEPVAQTAATEVTSSRPSPAPLWEAVRKFARDRFKEKEEPVSSDENDYASIIEAEMANLSFSESGDDAMTALPENVTKIRNTGT